ncbi:hypothetical protein ACLKA7_016116 [Drosophila subpalustris]
MAIQLSWPLAFELLAFQLAALAHWRIGYWLWIECHLHCGICRVTFTRGDISDKVKAAELRNATPTPQTGSNHTRNILTRLGHGPDSCRHIPSDASNSMRLSVSESDSGMLRQASILITKPTGASNTSSNSSKNNNSSNCCHKLELQPQRANRPAGAIGRQLGRCQAVRVPPKLGQNTGNDKAEQMWQCAKSRDSNSFEICLRKFPTSN